MKLLVGLSILAFSLSLTAAEKYVIKLTRPSKVGDKYEQKVVEGEKTKMILKLSGEEQPPSPDQNQDLQTMFEGTVEVLEVSAKGKETKSRITLKKLVTKAKDDAEVEVLKPDTVVDADLSGEKASFTIGGKAVSEEQAEVLGKFFKSDDSKASDDDIFGSAEPHAVGDKWKINTKLALEDLLEEGMKVEDGGSEGWVTLKGIVEVDGVQCLDIRGEMTFDKVQLPLPEGFVMSKGLVKMIFEGRFPIDGTKRGVQEKMQMKLDMKAGGISKGVPLEFDSSMQREMEGSMKQLE